MESDRIYHVIRIVRAAVLYFATVFGAGFVLGVVRMVFIVPRVGIRTAELIETPIMLAISYLCASWVIARFTIPFAPGGRLGVGLIALALLLCAEFGLVIWIQHLTVTEYILGRDPVSGTAYLISLLLFAMFPLIVRRGADI